MSGTSERMSAVDTTWLRMDRPTNLMMIVGVMILGDRVGLERLRSIVAERIVRRYRRFRQRVVHRPTGTFWEDDPDFDLGTHLVPCALPEPAGKAELERLVGDLAAQPLSAARPLWRVDVIERAARGSAIVVRIHHAIADGLALVRVLLSLTDPTPDGPAPIPAAPQRGPSRLLEGVRRLAGAPARLFAEPDQLATYARHGAGFAREMVHILALPRDSATRFKGRVGGVKRAAWSEPIPLASVKALGKKLGCSVNDVLLAAVTGALREYLRSKGDPTDGVELRAMVPVNLRGPADDESLGNRFGLVMLALPVYEADPFDRVLEVRERMRALKGSYQAPLSLGILAAVGLAPAVAQEEFLDMLAAKTSAVMTNVPGPQHRLFLAGAPITEQMFWVPQSGNIGIGVSILSYDGAVQLGLITDQRLVPDPEVITPLFRQQLALMRPD